MAAFIATSNTNNNDVLCGRGSGTNQLVGNRRFRDLVEKNRESYLTAKKKDKTNIAECIVNTIKNRVPAGRFLKLLDPDKDKETWFEISNQSATVKTSQALREKSTGSRERAQTVSIDNGFLKKTYQDQFQDQNEMETNSSSNTGLPLQLIAGRNSSNVIRSHFYTSKPFVVHSDAAVVRHFAKRKTISTSEVNLSTHEHHPSKDIVENVNENDVLLGRGGIVNAHVGNCRFRDIVKAHQPDYREVAKLEKKIIARKIVDIVQKNNGRFLSKDCLRGSGWYEVGNDRAREKTSQALREKAPESRKDCASGETVLQCKPQYQVGTRLLSGNSYTGVSSPFQDRPSQNTCRFGIKVGIFSNQSPPPLGNLREMEPGPFFKKKRIGGSC